MGVGGGGVADCVEVEEAGGWDVRIFVDGEAGSGLGVVGEKPGGAEGDYARGCRYFRGGLGGEGGGEVGGGDEIGG